MVFSTYASMMGIVMMLKPMVHTVIPPSVQNFVVSYIKSLVGSRSSTLAIIINDKNVYERGMEWPNELYHAALAYVSSKITPDEVVSDIYEGIKLTWRYVAGSSQTAGDGENSKFECLELSFDKKHKDLVLNSYVPYVEKEAKLINNDKRILKMYSECMGSGWNPVNFEHPSTFDTMAMNDELKRSVKEDLDRFIKRKDFYKRVGKAWNRGYLLYGPPGTGKSSLVAAMANYLKFDIYDLQLASVQGDAFLRRMLLQVRNRSILVVEDIDCSSDLPTRLQPAMTTFGGHEGSTSLTLSGLLNSVDGLWSSCGDERIIIFTTNNKDSLDDALIRPGRMDMHIYMGHCGFEGFKILASNYLGLSHDNDDTHPLYRR
ncbi:unnamed protein product [Arabis nemorensis]|uniref:AAA+ ATPase domain-containing protein n=1 Tax=Arabis nemorensis TaxID=586526 RepID=A0A565BE08_9BRAS|nr:unnamed protein product [Arabis nemorensis]